jgi:hypothetical protein
MVNADADSLLAALEVRKQAVRGFALGGALAGGAFVLFVLNPAIERSVPLYLLLGFVLAVSAGMLATTFLTLLAAYRLTRRL